MSAEKPHKSKLDLTGMKVPWDKGREENWLELESRLGDAPGQILNESRPNRAAATAGMIRLDRGWMAIAATLLLLLSISSFMRLHTRSFETPAGVRTAVTLPDQSTVELNAGSRLSYHPYWWWAGRRVKLEGEAFFSVRKGSDFQVASSLATTEVLGTSFNIFARGDTYLVSCHSGRVRVSEHRGGNTVTLEKSERTRLLSGGHFESGFFDPSPSAPWTGGMLHFQAETLRRVMDELERQFGIRISGDIASDLYYSGQFSLEQPLEQILELVCLPFGLSYEKSGSGQYHIHQ